MEQAIEECDERQEEADCPECQGTGYSMGFLGQTEWFRCRSCGMTFNDEEARSA